MCSYLTHTADLTGVVSSGDRWIGVRRAVVSFDHPIEAPFEHALCLDLRSADPASHVTVELDAASARRLAEAVLAALDSGEAAAVR